MWEATPLFYYWSVGKMGKCVPSGSHRMPPEAVHFAMAPEVLQGGNITHKTDVYSLGMIGLLLW